MFVWRRLQAEIRVVYAMSLKGNCFCIFAVDSGDRFKLVNYWVDIEIAKYTKYTHTVVTHTHYTLFYAIIIILNILAGL